MFAQATIVASQGCMINLTTTASLVPTAANVVMDVERGWYDDIASTFNYTNSVPLQGRGLRFATVVCYVRACLGWKVVGVVSWLWGAKGWRLQRVGIEGLLSGRGVDLELIEADSILGRLVSGRGLARCLSLAPVCVHSRAL